MPYFITPIGFFYFSLTKSEENLTFYSNVRKIFIATNVAETGLTLSTLKYCIDTGYFNSVEFNPNLGIKLIIQKNQFAKNVNFKMYLITQFFFESSSLLHWEQHLKTLNNNLEILIKNTNWKKL